METIYMAVVGAALSLLGVLLFGGVAFRSFRRLSKHGLAFCLICFGFLVSMATKPGPGDKCTVKFNLADNGVRVGGGDLTQQVVYAESAVAPEVEANRGWVFTGWDKAYTNVTKNLKVNAQYTNIIYAIKYENTKGAENPNPTEFTVTNEFEFAELGGVERYHFAGWTPSGIAAGTTSNVTVTASWMVATNKVQFFVMDGIRIGGGEETQYVEYGRDATAPIVEANPGFVFMGWDKPYTNVTQELNVIALYTNIVYHIKYENTKGVENPNPTTFTATNAFEFTALGDVEEFWFDGWTPSGIAKGTASNVTVTANWRDTPTPPPPAPIATNTVTFVIGEYGERVSGGELVQQIAEGDDAVAPEVKANAGYEFAGWDKAFTQVTEDLTVNALYTNTIYTITYTNTLGAANSNPTEFTVTNEIEFVKPGRVVGYEFIGWTPAKIAEGTTSNVLVTASWNELPPPAETNTVTFVIGEHGERIGGGELVQRVPEGYDAEAPIVKANVGYEFAGWDEVLTNVTEDLTVNALYTNTIYKIAYKETKGAANPNPTTFTITNEFEFAALASSELYEFIEWVPEGIAKGTTNNVTATAQWNAIAPYKVSVAYDDARGSVMGIPDARVEKGEKVTLKAKAEKGYVFAGWYYGEGFTKPVDDEYGDYRDTTLTISSIDDHFLLRAAFIEIKDDYCCDIEVEENEDGVPEGKITVNSGSLPTVSVSGLPSGLTFNKKTGELVVNKSKLKSGRYAFVISAKNVSGYKNDRLVWFDYETEAEEDDPEDYPGEYAVGVTVFEEVDFAAQTAKDSLSFGSLPKGLKLVKYLDYEGLPWYCIEGTPTKAGRFTATWKEVHYDSVSGQKSEETRKYYIYVDGTPSMYVDACQDALPDGCKATGAGVYAAGSKVTLKATAAKEMVFAGWYLDDEFESPMEGCDDYRNASLVITDFAVLEDHCQTNRYCVYYPKFIAKVQDDVGSISITDEVGDEMAEGTPWTVSIDDGGHAITNSIGWSQSIFVYAADSVSAPKLTIKGSISGITIKNYGTYAALYYDPTGKKMPKPGEYTLTFTAVNQSKDSTSRTLTVRVPNQVAKAEDGTPLLDKLNYGVGTADNECQYVLTVGENLEEIYGSVALDSLKTDASVLSGAGIKITGMKVSGLPSGVSCKNDEIAGVPTKAGTYVMTFTVTYTLSGKTYKTTATAFFRVNAIDATAVGTFNGGVFDAETNSVGTISATVSAKGALSSCKIIGLDGKSTTIKLKTQSLRDYESYYEIKGSDAGGKLYRFMLYPAGEDELGGFMYAVLPDEEFAAARQNVWGDKDYKKLGWLPDVNGEEVDYKADDLTLKFKSAGAVTAKRGSKSSSARFELVTYDVVVGWTGVMTVNVPDGDEGYCASFDVVVDANDNITKITKIQ